MTSSDRFRFGAKLRTTFEMLKKSISNDHVETMFQKLIDYRLEDLEKAFDVILDTYKTTPTLAEIREVMKNLGFEKITYKNFSNVNEIEEYRKLNLAGFIQMIHRNKHCGGIQNIEEWVTHADAIKMKLTLSGIQTLLTDYEKSLEERKNAQRASAANHTASRDVKIDEKSSAVHAATAAKKLSSSLGFYPPLLDSKREVQG